MKLSEAINIEDLHRLARRRLPRICFDFIEGGVEDERGLSRNEDAFQKHRLLPRYLVDVSQRDQSASLFGHSYASPFGISPTGTAGLFRRGAVETEPAAAARARRVRPGRRAAGEADQGGGSKTAGNDRAPVRQSRVPRLHACILAQNLAGA